jgi:hypothetical protein
MVEVIEAVYILDVIPAKDDKAYGSQVQNAARTQARSQEKGAVAPKLSGLGRRQGSKTSHSHPIPWEVGDQPNPDQNGIDVDEDTRHHFSLGCGFLVTAAPGIFPNMPLNGSYPY